jgi:hypothetical protein
MVIGASGRAAFDASMLRDYKLIRINIGLDGDTPLTEDYADRMPFRFNGQIARFTIDFR